MQEKETSVRPRRAAAAPEPAPAAPPDAPAARLVVAGGRAFYEDERPLGSVQLRDLRKVDVIEVRRGPRRCCTRTVFLMEKRKTSNELAAVAGAVERGPFGVRPLYPLLGADSLSPELLRVVKKL